MNWIKASDRLPPVGVPVLVRHRYRLEEYTPWAIGVRLHVTDDEDSPVYWTWTGVKLRPDVYYVNKKPRTSMLVHSLTAGDNQITHWAEITEPVHGMTQEERQNAGAGGVRGIAGRDH